jgi:hypothetical protein
MPLQNKLPSFICVGAQKAGTTTLHDILKQHPTVFLPIQKETKFFRDDDKYNKGVNFYTETYFKHKRANQIAGEIDPDYLFIDDCAKRIHDTIGAETKLIFVFRHPVDRAYSQYLMSVRRGRENKSFEEALLMENERYSEKGVNMYWFSYLSRGFYSTQLEEYLRYFKKENMRFFLFEKDITIYKKETIEDITKFIGAEAFDYNFDIKSNAASTPRFGYLRDIMSGKGSTRAIMRKIIPSNNFRRFMARTVLSVNAKPIKEAKLSNELRKQLFDKYYKEDAAKLQTLTKLDLSAWDK